jgi:fluoride exporter
MNRYLAVMLGGAFGSVARYALGVAIMSRYTGRFPITTFLINVTGSFLIGFAMTLIPDRGPAYLRPLVVTGVLGGYTTFSAFEWESYISSRGIAILYMSASVGIGFLACWTGAIVARYVAR